MRSDIMNKKKIIIIGSIIGIIIISIIIALLVNKKSFKFDDKMLDYRSNMEQSIIKSAEGKVSIKFNNKNDEISFYVYRLSKNGYTQYLYTFHNDDVSYKEFLDSHKDVHYNLVEYKDGYITRVVLENNKNPISVNKVKEKYKDKKYTIIE